MPSSDVFQAPVPCTPSDVSTGSAQARVRMTLEVQDDAVKEEVSSSVLASSTISRMRG